MSFSHLFITKLLKLPIEAKVLSSLGITAALLGVGSVVTYQNSQIIETAPVPFSVTYEADDSLLTTQQSTVSAGVVGSENNTYAIQRRDGIVVSKKLISTKVTKQPTPAVIKRGTQVDSEVSESQPIPYDEQTQNDPERYKSLPSYIKQHGVNGARTVIYDVHTLRGQEVSRTVISQSVTTQPIPEITAVGTKSDDRVTQYYWYCWDDGSGGPHHLGYVVYDDHYCTNQELLDAGYIHYIQ